MLNASIITCLILATLLTTGHTQGADTVTVELHSGKRLRARTLEPDPAGPHRVLLVSTTSQIRLQRSVDWSRIRGIAAPDSVLATLDVPDGIRRISLDTPAGPALIQVDVLPARQAFLAPPPAILSWGCGVPVPCLDPGVVVGVRYETSGLPCDAPIPHAAAVTIRELLVDVRPTNRDGLADWNALELRIAGAGPEGNLHPVRGTLSCTLWGQNAQLVRTAESLAVEDRRDLVRLGTWSQFLDPSAGDGPVQTAVLSLPPGGPEHKLTLGSVGMLAIQLDIPGQGRLATSIDSIPLRQAGAVRSRALSDEGTTWLPGEATSSGRSASGDWPAPLSGIRPDRRRFTVQP